MTETKGARFKNPFRPGAGHMPPYLAGRDAETREFSRLLQQDTILENLVLTGLRGLGKTVLLETFKPMAIEVGWLWAGTDLSEAASISDDNLAMRLLTDLSVVTSQVVVKVQEHPRIGLTREKDVVVSTLDFTSLVDIYNSIPGLVIDKLKGVLEFVWSHLAKHGKKGLIFAYDEAQNLADQATKEQYPLSLLLDTFQSIQRKGIPFMLALTGLPTLFPKLVEARTFAERMFRVIFLHPLDEGETRAAVMRPIQKEQCPVKFKGESVDAIWQVTRGYPYFIQFVCRECYDVWVQNIDAGKPLDSIPMNAILRKLDTDFFAGRWARATDRQRDLLAIISALSNCDGEFTVQDIVEAPENKQLGKPFSASHVNQMLGSLADASLIYKNRHGKYSLAVPLLSDFIRRQIMSLS